DQRRRSAYVQLFLQAGKAEAVLSEDGHRRLRGLFQFGPAGDAVPAAAVDGFVRGQSRPGRLTAALSYYRVNTGAWAAGETPGRVSVPTQLVWGDQDPALGRAQAEGTAAHVDGEYRLEVLKGAGHWLQ